MVKRSDDKVSSKPLAQVDLFPLPGHGTGISEGSTANADTVNMFDEHDDQNVGIFGVAHAYYN